MKNLLNNLRKKIVKLFGGYNYTSHEALTELVKDKFNTISDKDILRETKDGWLFNEEHVAQEVVKVLSGQADAIIRMKVWEILKQDIKYISNKTMFLKSQTESDLIAGKLMLYLLDIMEKRLKSISGGKGNVEL